MVAHGRSRQFCAYPTRRLQKTYARHLVRLRKTGEGVTDKDGAVHNECMVPADGPDSATSRHAVNLWGETTLYVGILIWSLPITLQIEFMKISRGLERSIAFSRRGQRLFPPQLSPVSGQQGVRLSTIACHPHPRNTIQILTPLSTPLVLTMLHPHPCRLNHGCLLARVTPREASCPRRCLHNLGFHPNQFPKSHHLHLSERSHLPRQNQGLQLRSRKPKKMSKFGRTNDHWRIPSLRVFRKDFLNF